MPKLQALAGMWLGAWVMASAYISAAEAQSLTRAQQQQMDEQMEQIERQQYEQQQLEKSLQMVVAIVFFAGTMLTKLAGYLIRDSAPPWQNYLGAPICLAVASTSLLIAYGCLQLDTDWWKTAIFVFFGILYLGAGIVAFQTARAKTTLDVSEGAYVSICEDVPEKSELHGMVLLNHVGQVQGWVGGNLVSVHFPQRARTEGDKIVGNPDHKPSELGGTFNVNRYVLRQSTTAAYNAQKLVEGYAPPTLTGQAQQSTSPTLPEQPPELTHADTASQDLIATSLSDFLAAENLQQYEDALRDLGATATMDLQGLTEEDCVEIGMRKLEIKRLFRSTKK
jgi:hypothetical protein